MYAQRQSSTNPAAHPDAKALSSPLHFTPPVTATTQKSAVAFRLR